MPQVAKTLIGIGMALIIAGLIAWAIMSVFPGFKPGRLPGDIAIEKPGASFYFPITTMILVSVGLSFILWLIGMVSRR
ncbi:MAG: DUF2905 domain-containing protein [Fimbriimonadaceae bacterium]|nr:MAG: DUF2905 domain-containing protein [Fimbriimonadaceae bacterium]